MSEFFELPVEEEIPYEEVAEIIPFEETPEETGVNLVLDFTAKLIPYAEKVITISEESDSETTEEYQALLDQIKVLKEQLESVQLGLSGTYETSETFNDLMAKGAELNWEMTRSLEDASLEIGNLGQLAESLREDVDIATGYASQAAIDAAEAHNAAVEAEQKAEAARIAAAAAIKGSVVQYSVGSSETVAPTTGWSEATPTRTTGTFIWMRTIITYGDDTTSTTNPVLLTGPAGASGTQGLPGPSGTATYTWLKYADTPTTGISDSPTGKTYMGLAHNKTSATESNTYADYSWSLIKGTDGVPGTSGTDGETFYTWIKYGTSAAGAGISDDPAGKTHIGIAYNKPTATESSTPGDYQWSLIQGPQGTAGKGISGTPAVTYQTHTNGNTAPTGTWATTVPTVTPGQFLWTRTITNYTDSTSTTAYSVSAAGTNGTNGTAGTNGTNGQTSYLHVAYSTSPTGATGFSTTDPSGKTYMGTLTDFTVADSTTPGLYDWVLIKGADGSTGATGKGISSSVVTYQSHTVGTGVGPTGTWLTTPPTTPENQFLWTRTVLTFTDGATTTTYSIAKQGGTGATGATGVSVIKVTPFFIQKTTASGTPAQPTGTGTPAGWSIAEPSYLVNTTLWRAERVDYSNSTSTWTTPTAVTAYTIAGSAIASANGKNTRNTSIKSPLESPVATANINGMPLVEGDTWWKINNATARVVVGQWSWDGSAWKAETIGTEVIANLDVSKLTAGVASMDILAAKKMAVDFGTFKVLTADKLAVVSTGGGVYPDPMFLDEGLGALRATNTSGVSYDPATHAMSGTGNMWLTREAQDEGKTLPLVKGERYTVRVWGTGLTAANGRKFAVKDDAGYAVVDPSYFTGGMSVLIQPGSDNARVQIWRTTGGTATHTITRVEIRQGIGGTLIEDGAITTDKVFAGAIGTKQLAANSVTANQMAIGDTSNMATIDVAVPGNVTYDDWTDGVLASGYGGEPWSIRVPETTASLNFMFRPNAGPVPLKTGDRIRVEFEAYGASGTESFGTRVWTYPSRSGSSFTLVPVPGSPAQSLTTTPQKFILEGTATAGVEGRTTYLIGMSELSATANPRVRNVRAYRMGAGELIVDGSISGDKITGGTIVGTEIISPGTNLGDSLTIGGQALVIRRADADGDPIVTTSLGGSSYDRLVLADSAGRTGVSFDGASGNGALDGTLSVNDLTIGGDTFASYIEAMPLGVVTFGELIADTPYAGTSALGLAMMWFPMRSNRMYRAKVSGMLAAGTAGDMAQLSWQWFSPSTGIVGIANFPRVTGTADHVDYSVIFKGHGTGPRRIGLLYKNATANRPIFWSGRPNYPVQVSIEDLGLANYNGNDSSAEFTIMGGTPLSGGGTVPPTPATTFVKTYSPSWTRAWRGSGQVTDYLQHGYYGGYQRYSAAGFDVASDMSGATVIKAEVRLTNASWWGSTGTARIGTSTVASAPSSPITSGSTTNVSGWAQGAQKWVTIPWTTSQRAITLGVGAGTGTDGYGKFKNNDVQLRLTYSK